MKKSKNKIFRYENKIKINIKRIKKELKSEIQDEKIKKKWENKKYETKRNVSCNCQKKAKGKSR